MSRGTPSGTSPTSSGGGERSEGGKKYDTTGGQVSRAWVLTQGENVILIPGPTKLLVCPILRSDQPRIFVDTTNVLQNLKENVNAGKIKVSKLLERIA